MVCTWLGILPPRSKWVIYGCARFTLLAGSSVELFGTLISPGNLGHYNVYSPSTHVPIDLKVPESVTGSMGFPLNTIISPLANVTKYSSELLEDFLNKLVDMVGSLHVSSAAVLLQSLSSPVIDSIKLLRRFGCLFSPPNSSLLTEKLVIRGDTFSFELASDGEGFFEAPVVSMISQKLLSENGLKNPKILLCGPSNSGKSTLMRLLVNRLLSSGKTEAVVVLDCDVGQSEFTPAGMISLTFVRKPLLGPPFSHPLEGVYKPARQCFFGGASPSVNPAFYVRCLRYVFEAFDELNGTQYPLIVNTMGWTQGLGLTLIIDQIKLSRPDMIVQIYQDGAKANSRQNLPPLTPEFMRTSKGLDYAGFTYVSEVGVVKSITFLTLFYLSGAGGFAASHDHRDLTMLGHLLSELFNAETSLPGSGPSGRGPSPLGHPTAHLLDCLPYRVPLASPQACAPQWALAVHLLQPPIGTSDASTFQIPSIYTLSSIMACLNATLVALCRVPEEVIIPPSKPEDLTLLSEALPCDCYGLALVRSVDPSTGLIYLTTGIPKDRLAMVNAILRGQVDLPHVLFTEQVRTKSHLVVSMLFQCVRG
ncbi:unnamed protein product [Mesocestoides corti]|uniref:Uncharacterized protein n=1 Tax=Mesocestoides corti TaxID=53468 RepID=A0A3P6HAM1_MESCO|nr:unnamed protein product [Mesocestoides corti]